MNELEKARLEIEETDKKLVILFEKRFMAVKKVVEYKKKNNLPIFDEEREKYLLDKNLSYLNDKSLESYYYEFLLKMFAISKDYQKDLL